MRNKQLKNKNGFLYSQEQMKAIFIPLLKKEGKLYRKSKNVFARLGHKGEQIETITGDGKETQNIVKDNNSFVVKNQTDAGEMYILSNVVFREKYEFLRKANGRYDEYKPTGKVRTLKLNNLLWTTLDLPLKQFFFEAPWGKKMIFKKHDYLVCPLDYSEVYRIARKEFWETYNEI